jgi:hypothetical protein
MSPDELRLLAEMLGDQELSQFCGKDDVSSESYGYSHAEIEREQQDRDSWGARRFIEYFVQSGGEIHPLATLSPATVEFSRRYKRSHEKEE